MSQLAELSHPNRLRRRTQVRSMAYCDHCDCDKVSLGQRCGVCNRRSGDPKHNKWARRDTPSECRQGPLGD